MSSEPHALPPETALIARGVRRLLRARGFSRVMELPLVEGWRADIVAVNGEDQVLIVEIQPENITSAAGGAMQPAGGDLSEAQELRLRHAEAMRLKAASPTISAKVSPASSGMIAARVCSEIAK